MKANEAIDHDPLPNPQANLATTATGTVCLLFLFLSPIVRNFSLIPESGQVRSGFVLISAMKESKLKLT